MPGEGARVLVVDDIPEMRQLLTTVLNLRGLTNAPLSPDPTPAPGV